MAWEASMHTFPSRVHWTWEWEAISEGPSGLAFLPRLSARVTISAKCRSSSWWWCGHRLNNEWDPPRALRGQTEMHKLCMLKSCRGRQTLQQNVLLVTYYLKFKAKTVYLWVQWYQFKHCLQDNGWLYTCSSVTEKIFWITVHLMAMQRLPYKYASNFIKAYCKCGGKNMQNIKSRCMCVHWCVCLYPMNYHKT